VLILLISSICVKSKETSKFKNIFEARLPHFEVVCLYILNIYWFV